MHSLTATLQRSNVLSLLQVLGGSLLIALFAHISVYLPFSPVPLTGQTLAVLLVGGLLGSKKGMLAVLAYIAEGMMGFPVLAGGAMSPMAIIGPTGGYIVGMVVQAYLVGFFAERKSFFSLPDLTLGCLVGCAVQLTMGALWLSSYVGWENTMSMGITPFIPGELVKVALVCTYLYKTRR